MTKAKTKPKTLVSMYCSEVGEPEIVVNDGSTLDVVCVYLKLTTTLMQFLKANDPAFDESMAAAMPIYVGTVARACAFGADKPNRRKVRQAVRELSNAITEHINKEA